MYKLVLLFIFLFASLSYKAQAQFQHSYGTQAIEYGQGVQLTSDNGYIIAGRSGANILGGQDGVLVKTAANGALQWTRVYGGDEFDHLNSVRQFTTAAGNPAFVAVGTTTSFGPDEDVYLIGTNGMGVPSFATTFGGVGADWGYCVQNIFDPVTNQPGFAIVGETSSFPNAGGGSNIYVIITDITGALLRSAVIDSDNKDDKGMWIEQTQDGGFIVVGSTTNACGAVAAASNEDIFVVRLSSTLNIMWNNILGKTELIAPDIANCVKQNADGSFIITGTTSSFGAGNSDSFLLSLSAGGIFNWMNTYGEANNETGITLLLDTDSLGMINYVVSGSSNSFTNTVPPNYDAMLYKTDAAGNLIWTRTYGRNGAERGFEVTYSATPGYAFTGHVNSFGLGNTDVYLVETNKGGRTFTQCQRTPIQVVIPQQPCIAKKAVRTLVDMQINVPRIHALVEYEGRRCESGAADKTLFDMGESDKRENKTLASFTVSPNPANSTSVRIDFNNKAVRKGKLGIYTLQGKLLNQVIVDASSSTIDVSNLPAGIYLFKFISLNDSNQESQLGFEVIKFIKE